MQYYQSEIINLVPLREKCPYSEFFWSAFSRIRNEYSRMQTRKTPNTDTFYVVKVVKKKQIHQF